MSDRPEAPLILHNFASRLTSLSQILELTFVPRSSVVRPLVVVAPLQFSCHENKPSLRTAMHPFGSIGRGSVIVSVLTLTFVPRSFFVRLLVCVYHLLTF